MQRSIWSNISRQIARWRIGIVVIGLVTLARLTGSLQFFEWITLDYFLRQLPSEPIDERIVIVGIDDRDIRQIGSYPIPDREIAQLLKKLQTYKPAVIGLDLVRDLPVEPGYQERVKVLRESENLIGIEKVLGPDLISPPSELPSNRIGFADVLLDADGHGRRSFLSMWRDEARTEYIFSLPLRLAEAYLETRGITLENGIRDPNAMRFGETELPRFLAHMGGYVGADDGGVQVLLNFRRGQLRFRTVSFQDILNGQIKDPNWLRDSIVIIGITADSVKDTINTTAIANLNPPGVIKGAEFHAHATSQIVSAVLDGRPLLRTWANGWEYLWIVACGLLAIPLGGLFQSPLKNLFGVVIVSFVPVGISYLLLWVGGWWIPVIPVWLVFIINGIAYTAFYQNERALKYQIEVKNLIIQERLSAIRNAFDTIHNGPLQILAHTLRVVREQDVLGEQLFDNLKTVDRDLELIISASGDDSLQDIHNGPQQILKYILREWNKQDLGREQLLNELETLNQEIRSISDYLQQESFQIEVSEPDNFLQKLRVEPKSFHLGNGKILDLSLPIDELFQIVYRETIERPHFPNFQPIKARVVEFKPIESRYLSPKQKQKLCTFLEEALCNVGKHAKGATRLITTGTKNEGWYTLTIQDNGSESSSSAQGQGTKQCRELEKLLGGKFKRQTLIPQGTLCEFTWQLTEPNQSLINQIGTKLEQLFSCQNSQ